MPVAMAFGALVQIVPTGYIVLTGTAPMWARVILGVWLSLWAVFVIVGSYAKAGAK